MDEHYSELNNILKEMLELGRDLELDEDLFSLGMTSLKSIELIIHIEDTFKIAIDDNGMIFNDNYKNITSILKMVESYKSMSER